MTEQSTPRGLPPVVRTVAPGLAWRVKRRGVVRGTASYFNPARLSSVNRQRDSYLALGRRFRTSSALRMAEVFAEERQPDLALAVIDGALLRYPRSSQVLARRAAVRYDFDRDGVMEDLAAATEGDLRRASLAAIAVEAIRAYDVVDVERLARQMRDRASSDETAAAQWPAAQRVFDLADSYLRGETLVFPTGDEEIEKGALRVFIAWARRDFRWEDIDMLVAEVQRREQAGVDVDLLLEKLALVIRARGQFERSLAIVQPVAERKNRRMSTKLVSQNTVDLGLKRDGWPAPAKAAPAGAANGAMAYLLHNSLPFTSGGYATRTHGLLAAMARREWTVDAITRPQYPLDRPEGAGVKKAQLREAAIIDGVRYSRILDGSPVPTTDQHIDHFATRVAERAATERWGVIQAASNHFVGLAAVEAAARVGVPSVYEVRGLWEITRKSREPEYESTDQYAMTERLEADACRLADHSFAITEGLRSLMIERGVPADHISLLPNGVDIARFTPKAPQQELRDSLGLQGKTVIGYVGSVVDYEGLELLVDAVSILVSRKLPVALMIVGDGKVFDSVKARVTEHGLWDHVVMPGRVPHAEAEAYYTIIDIAPFPRLPMPVTELVSPLKPFEAMAMAKPVVVSSVAALTEIVEDGSNGRVFAKGDVDSLADTLAELIEDPEQRERLGSDARDWVVANRSWDALSERIVTVYDKLGVPAPRPAH